MAASTVTQRLRASGIVDPAAAVAEAQRAGLPLKFACAMLEKESAGGHNVFGHDPHTIFAGAGGVTEAKYRDYKRKRVASGNKLMQGVGPCQLTWWSLQDEADKAGGCWRPEINMRIGFAHLASLVKQHGETDGARRYNGSGDAAVAYGNDLVAKARKWEAILAGASGAGAGVAAVRVVRVGDAGPLVEKITRRLSYVRSRKTRAAYLDGARRGFGPKVEAALKAFQGEHGLTADGVFGPATARKLNRAVKLEKARRKGGTTPVPRPAPVPVSAPNPKAPRVKLPALVAQVRHLDDETDAAWKTLVAYAERRRRLLERLRATKAGGAQVDTATAKALSDMAAILLRIEDKLGVLVEVEQHEAAPAPPLPPGPAASAAMPSGSATTDPGSATVAEATVVQAAEGVSAPGGNGVGGPPSEPASPPPQRTLADLSEAELAHRVARLDRALDRSRAELVRRYAEVEEELTKLLPAQRRSGKTRAVARPKPTRTKPGPGPRKDPKPGPVVADPSRDRQGGKVVTTKLGDRGLLVRRSKLALARFLAAKGNQEHAKLRRALRREARAPGRAALATPQWQQAVRAAQHLTGRPVTGELDGDLTRLLAPYWPRDNAAKRVLRSSPAWRTIPGQLTPNFNVKEFHCKDAHRTSYLEGLMREQGLSKKAARERAKGLATRLERVRKAGGDRPLIITSAFRTKAYNASLTGSATNSAHTRGFACDTTPPPGISLDQHKQHVLGAFECGVGYYPPGRGYFIHGDFDHTLGGRRTW